MATVAFPADQAPILLEEAARRLRGAPGLGGFQLVTGGDPNDVYPVPRHDQFVDDFGEPIDYLHGGDIEEIANALIATEAPELRHASHARIRYLWRRQGGGSHGRVVLGRCHRASGMLRYWADCDFVISLSADHLRDMQATAYQVEALVYHELLHITTDMYGRLTLRGHDWEGFVLEILRYGLWKADLEQIGDAVQQLRLDLGDGARP